MNSYDDEPTPGPFWVLLDIPETLTSWGPFETEVDAMDFMAWDDDLYAFGQILPSAVAPCPHYEAPEDFYGRWPLRRRTIDVQLKPGIL